MAAAAAIRLSRLSAYLLRVTSRESRAGRSSGRRTGAMFLRTISSESRAGRSSLVRAGKSSVQQVVALEKLAPLEAAVVDVVEDILIMCDGGGGGGGLLVVV